MSVEAVGGLFQKVGEDSAFAEKFYEAMLGKADNTAPLVKFANENGFEFTDEDLAKVEENAEQTSSGELSDEDFESVAGGKALGPMPITSYPTEEYRAWWRAKARCMSQWGSTPEENRKNCR